MCGIAGVMARNGGRLDRSALRTMTTAMAHRGPDGQGEYVLPGVALAQTRLAIIDLETGDQPLFEPGGAVLVANAEIYNYLELRGTFDGPFATNSDCEPALHLFRRDGLDFAEGLRGMYAIAIYDPQEEQLVLARDPFGIKPLYYMQREDCFAFASEPQALIAAGFADRAIERSVCKELLQLQYTTGDGTIFSGIHRVLPGETLVVRDGSIVDRRRRSALPMGAPAVWTEAEAQEKLDRALRDSVLVHQRSDVPYGMFLSGGIDSTVVLSLMAELNDRPVQAFTAGFSGTDVADERVHARAVADALGAEISEVEFGETDFWQLLPEIVGVLDDPTADYAVLPTYKLAGLAKANGITVILSGEGGDEMFAGYGRYRSAMRPIWLGGRNMRSRGILDGVGVLRGPARGWRDGLAAAEMRESQEGRSRLQVAQAVDCADWLPNDLLTKLDRCLMAHGVEGRTPFLDPAIADVAFRLPDALKVCKGQGKWLLRRWLDERLPMARPFSKKRGFTVPVAEWILRRGDTLGPLVAAQQGVVELCEPADVEALYLSRGKRVGFAAWALLFYALWHHRHVLQQPLGGDVFETLGDGQ